MNDEKAEAQISVDSELLTEKTINLSLDDGNTTRLFSKQDFQKRDNPTIGKLATSIVETSKEGRLNVEFEVTDSETEQKITEGSFDLDLKEDWRYSIYLFADSATVNPIDGCIGCEGYYSFGYTTENDNTNDDSLYVVWAGNSISEQVTY